MIVWLDLETTGLDPKRNAVLEVAAIVTDDALNVVTKFERVVYWESADRVIAKCRELEFYHAGTKPLAEVSEYQWTVDSSVDIDPACVRMHWLSGLWPLVRRGEQLETVDADLAEVIADLATTRVEGQGAKPPQLAGNTIGFDRSFMAEHLPKSLRACHYRSIDVTALNETARRFWPAVHDVRPGLTSPIAHRAMADVESSIEQYKFYLNQIGPKQ